MYLSLKSVLLRNINHCFYHRFIDYIKRCLLSFRESYIKAVYLIKLQKPTLHKK